MFAALRPALILFAVLTLLTGAAYPLVVTGIAQGLFAHAANGSLIERDGQFLGSEFIGQSFKDSSYFWGRPSATSAVPYDAAASTGSNLGPTNPALFASIRARVAKLHAVDPTNTALVPLDLVTSSGSGLDPHISPAAAEYQVARVARVREMAPSALRRLVASHTEPRTFGVLGEARVNVLGLNLALNEKLQPR